jgi:hypothetical protein
MRRIGEVSAKNENSFHVLILLRALELLHQRDFSMLARLFSLIFLTFLATSVSTYAQSLSPDAVARLNELFLRSLEIGDAYNTVDTTAEHVSDAVRYAQQAEDKQTPINPNTDWKTIISNYTVAAKTIQSEKLVTDFDETPFTVSWMEFWACHTRDGAVSVLEQYSNAFGAAIERGLTADARYASLLNDFRTMDDGATKMMNLLAPFVNDFGAANDFLALMNQVKPSLADLINVTQKRKDELERALQKVRTRKSNLDGNLSQLRSTDCNLAGTWSGSITMEGVNQPLTLEIRGQPSHYDITYSIQGRPNKDICVLALNAKEHRLDFRPFCASSLRFSLTFSGSFTSLTGIETDDDDSDVRYPLSMQRR